VSLVGGIEEKVSSLLTSHRCCLETLARALLENETLEKAEIRGIIAQAGERPQGDQRGADATHPRARHGSTRA
jgi:ATP-dependent Zn protease